MKVKFLIDTPQHKKGEVKVLNDFDAMNLIKAMICIEVSERKKGRNPIIYTRCFSKQN